MDDHEKKLCAFSFLAAEADGEVLGTSGTAAAAAAVRTWKKFTEHEPRQWKMSMENVLVCNSGLLAFHADRRGRVLQKVFSTALHLPMVKSGKKCAIVADLHTIDYKNAGNETTFQRTSNSHSRSSSWRSLSHSPSSGLFAASWCLPGTPKGASSTDVKIIED